jgi:hypothetical protein
MPISVRWEPTDAPAVMAGNLKTAPDWMPKVVSKAAHQLGPAAVDIMRDVTDANRYTGALGESISDEYSNNDYTVTISPKAMRGGKWDAGLLLEFGTRPIPNAPWAPIKAWANFRGLLAFPVWLKIRRAGVSAHPFLDRALENLSAEIDPVLEELLRAAISEFIFAGFS